VADRIKEWYDVPKEERVKRGLNGHEFVMSEESMLSVTSMSNNFINHMDKAFEMWKPRKPFSLFKV